MGHGLHHGVVALVTNPERTRFFIQQKDEGYRPFPLGYSLFGGAVEAGESLAQALARELREELGAVAERLLAAEVTLVFSQRPLAVGFELSLFEVVLEAHLLESLAEVAVLEGRRGVVVSREELTTMPLIWGLGAVVDAYLDARDGALPGAP
jgi:8-oxo-dGTP pyrophosphatase MutT (NUDIX family)